MCEYEFKVHFDYYDHSFDDSLDFIGCYRLRTINESAHSMLSDDEYDKTEDDLHTTYLRNGRKIKRPSAPPMEEELPKKRKSGDEVRNSKDILLYIELRMNQNNKNVVILRIR